MYNYNKNANIKILTIISAKQNYCTYICLHLIDYNKKYKSNLIRCKLNNKL